ncbi:hypothetical protein [Streptomyces sp. NPDC095817]|uniref:hypothetical protein n=1 Tax=Streptomyces sp. NPDC095817 TaxID=3155082 RepID=UPI0033276072
MSNDLPSEDNNADEVRPSNAPLFFDRYPPETAYWLAEICDEAVLKAGDSSTEFRKVVSDAIKREMRGGVVDALRAADDIIAANAPGVKYIEQQYLKLDQARAAEIKTGLQATGGSSGPTGTTKPAGETRDQNAPGSDSEDGHGGKTAAGPGCGPGAMTGPGTAVTVIEGASGKKPDANKGTGHQGTLFMIVYADYRASVPALRKRAQTEHRRLYGVTSEATRQMRIHADELDFLDRLDKADEVLENLISTHRTETSIAGVLRAAGQTPDELGLTAETVLWLDRQLKAA